MVIGAHSSMAEQPAHNRLGLGSSPGGPTTVLERLHGLKRGWAEIERRGSARRVDRLPHRSWVDRAGSCNSGLKLEWAEIERRGSVVLERSHGLKRRWAEIESGGSVVWSDCTA